MGRECDESDEGDRKTNVCEDSCHKPLVNVASIYAPQISRSAREKDDSWESALMVMMSKPQNEIILLGGDLNGHVGRESSGYKRIHGGYGILNAESERILEFCEALQLFLCNTWFLQRPNSKA